MHTILLKYFQALAVDGMLRSVIAQVAKAE
jgi:hypothetical protein